MTLSRVFSLTVEVMSRSREHGLLDFVEVIDRHVGTLSQQQRNEHECLQAYSAACSVMSKAPAAAYQLHSVRNICAVVAAGAQ